MFDTKEYQKKYWLEVAKVKEKDRRSTQERKDYLAEYGRKNKERYREYKRIWMIRYRARMKKKTIALPKLERRGRPRKTKYPLCARCELRLDSIYAGISTATHCESCSKMV